MKNYIYWIFSILILMILLWGSLFLYYPITISATDTLSIFWGDYDELIQITILDLRLPRSLVAIAIGANLAIAGALLQTVTRNPLASPSLLGVNAGASLAMVIATAVAPTLFVGYSIVFITSLGGALSWLLVMLISGGWYSKAEKSRVILSGIVVSLFCLAITKLVIILSEDHAANVMNWLAGGIVHTRWLEWITILPFFLLGLVFCTIFAHKMNLLNLSDESAQSLGVNLLQLRWIVNVVALLMVGSSVSIAGPIAFIGLLAPHLAHYIIGYDLRKSLPMSILVGASLMLIADIIARALVFPYEIPAGAVLALIGSPIFVLFASRRHL